jgi:TonB family protein
MKSYILEARSVEVDSRRMLGASMVLHALLLGFVIVSPAIRWNYQTISISAGKGGGNPGESIYSVGLADDLGGGSGLHKPSPIPQAPVLADNAPKAEKNISKLPKPPSQAESSGIALPDLNSAKSKKKKEKDTFKMSSPAPKVPDNQIPVVSGAGAGGTGARAGGRGGGSGGGQGVSIGAGSGGFAESWYARAVERRISENWLRSLIGPNLQGRYQVVIAFVIQSSGYIKDIVVEKSSNQATVDMSAMRAVTAANPLPPVPSEYRGQNLRILAYFEYPPTP